MPPSDQRSPAMLALTPDASRRTIKSRATVLPSAPSRVMCLVTVFLLLGLHGRSKSTFGQRQGDATKLLDVSRTDAVDRRSVVVGKAPADIFAGCCPSKFNENCRYWAAKFAFAVFPQRKVRVMKLPCVDGKQYESEGHSNERCEAYGFNSTLPMPDLLFCE